MENLAFNKYLERQEDKGRSVLDWRNSKGKRTEVGKYKTHWRNECCNLIGAWDFGNKEDWPAKQRPICRKENTRKRIQQYIKSNCVWALVLELISFLYSSE